MAIKTYKPVTPSQRYIARSTFDEITKTKPERRLTTTRKRTGGRNNRGRITLRLHEWRDGQAIVMHPHIGLIRLSPVALTSLQFK